jgi:DNA-binding MarR family transcriptional regulator
MARKSSSPFTTTTAPGQPFGPPLIGALLRIPLEAVHRRMLERLHEHGFTDLDVAHLTVFQYPGPQDARPSELAGRLRMSKQALGYLLGQLELGGYLERQPDPNDNRGKRISVTAKGVRAIGVIRDAVAEVESEWARQLGAARFDQLRELLGELDRSSPTVPS